MYDALKPFEPDFSEISRTLTDGAKRASVDEIVKALKLTAERFNDATAETDVDRNNLAKLYRGFIAASRVLERLQSAKAGSL
ncbi:type III secretion protein [Paraburkholderia humisilvae]|uniref:Type III secretion protein n=1 Tax=Paraburkholderia humisilvae TaxID=627669 RepID=A0A6J5F223_9BURK|nr:type III secretion protein [Paraburkholderia humisilvae]CAB3772858.1 hypothetical protein LMG29542_06998 [Paraburkholderia humisilvae]